MNWKQFKIVSQQTR